MNGVKFICPTCDVKFVCSELGVDDEKELFLIGTCQSCNRVVRINVMRAYAHLLEATYVPGSRLIQ